MFCIDRFSLRHNKLRLRNISCYSETLKVSEKWILASAKYTETEKSLSWLKNWEDFILKEFLLRKIIESKENFSWHRNFGGNVLIDYYLSKIYWDERKSFMIKGLWWFYIERFFSRSQQNILSIRRNFHDRGFGMVSYWSIIFLLNYTEVWDQENFLSLRKCERKGIHEFPLQLNILRLRKVRKCEDLCTDRIHSMEIIIGLRQVLRKSSSMKRYW